MPMLIYKKSQQGAGSNYIDGERDVQISPLIRTNSVNVTEDCDVLSSVSSSPLRFCVLHELNQPCTTKKIALNADGTLDKKTFGLITSAEIRVLEVATIEEFGEVIASLSHNEVAMYSLPQSRGVEVTHVVTARFLQRTGIPQYVARTKENFAFSSGPGILMLDYDPPSDGGVMYDGDELVDLLRRVIPELQHVPLLWYPSSSSYIYHCETNDELSGLRGQRIYIPVSDARQIPEMGNLVCERLWAAGYGRYMVSKSGALLERAVFDTSVWDVTRIDFAAGALCQYPLEQRRGEPVLYAAEHGERDGCLHAIAPLSEAEKRNVAHYKDAARRAVAERGASVKAQFEENYTSAMITRLVQAGVPEKIATVRAHEASNRLATGVLSADHLVYVLLGNGAEPVAVNVAELVANPTKYHRALTLDPVEPEYGGWRQVGVLYLDSKKPTLYSQAHGGKCYVLDVQYTIEVADGALHTTVDEIVDLLRRMPGFYDMGDQLVHVSENGAVLMIDQDNFPVYIQQLAQFVTTRIAKGIAVRKDIDVPHRVVRAVLGLRAGRGLKKMSGILYAPTMLPDGSLIDVPGHHAESGLYYAPRGEVPAIPANPTQAELRAAFEFLWQPFAQFPYVNNRDRAVALAAILTAVIRPVLPTSPFFAVTSPTQGTGKTLLATTIGTLCDGEYPEPVALPRSEEELEKMVTSIFRQGLRVLFADNVVGIFDSPGLAKLATAQRHTSRILGGNTMGSYENNLLVLLTGNNFLTKGDMVRRCLPCRLDAQTRMVINREFSFSPNIMVRENWMHYVAAALTILRGFASTKFLRQAPGSMASFEVWDSIIRQGVLWLDKTLELDMFGDVMECVFAGYEDAGDEEFLDQLLEGFDDYYRSEPFVLGDVVEFYDQQKREHQMCSFVDALRVIEGNEKHLTAQRLSTRLRMIENRISRSGLQLVKAGVSRKNSTLWQVVAVRGDTSVDTDVSDTEAQLTAQEVQEHQLRHVKNLHRRAVSGAVDGCGEVAL